MDSDYLLPPPAYSEQEFDQKISQATDLSNVTQSLTVDEEGWERYDPAAFEGSSAAPLSPALTNTINHPTSVSSSSRRESFDHQDITHAENDKSTLSKLPTIIPLRVEKKSQSKYDHSYNASAGSSVNKASLAYSLPRQSYNDDWQYGSSDTNPIPTNEIDDQEMAMPEQEMPLSFHSPSPPFFDGQSSPFVASNLNLGPVPQHNWRGGDSQPNTLYDPYYQTVQLEPHSPRQSLPVNPRPPVTLQDRPKTSYSHRPQAFHSPSGPLVEFNPSVAYGKPTSKTPTVLTAPASPRANVQYDPHSFYNSAVSSQMNPLRPSLGEAHQTPPLDQSQRHGLGPPLRPVHHPQFNSNEFQPRNSQQFDNLRSTWQLPSRPVSNHFISNAPRVAAAADGNRFSQYPNGSAQDGIYRGQNAWYSPR